MTEKMPSAALLNRVARDKLPQVLAHILDRRASPESAEQDVFSPEEVQQLVGMLHLSAGEIDQVVAVVTRILQDAAAFGGVCGAGLQGEGVETDVVAALEKLWRKKGRAAAEKLRVAPVDKADAVKNIQWQLQVALAQRYMTNQTDPIATFQLQTSRASTGKDEVVGFEMTHQELFEFFQNLNTIQRTLDQAPQ